MIPSDHTLFLFHFDIAKPGEITSQFHKALPLIYDDIERTHNDIEKYGLGLIESLPTFEFHIGKNIEEASLKTLFKDIYTISNSIFYCGLLKGSIIFEPDTSDTKNDENISIYFNYFKSTIQELDPYEDYSGEYFKMYSDFVDGGVREKFKEKFTEETFHKEYKSCLYLGFAPIIAYLDRSKLLTASLNPNDDFKNILRYQLNAKAFDKLAYEKFYGSYSDNKRIYNNNDFFSDSDIPRMCDICRDSGSCLGIQDCGFI